MILANEVDWNVPGRLTNPVITSFAAAIINYHDFEVRSTMLLRQASQAVFEWLPIVKDAYNHAEEGLINAREVLSFLTLGHYGNLIG